MQICPACKSELDEAPDADFCWNCGAVLSDNVQFANLAAVRTEASSIATLASDDLPKRHRRLRAAIALVAFLAATAVLIVLAVGFLTAVGMASQHAPDWLMPLGLVATLVVFVLLLYWWASF